LLDDYAGYECTVEEIVMVSRNQFCYGA
jgi:hypothetical protein